MNRGEALEEARRRWGPFAVVVEHSYLGPDGDTTRRSAGYYLQECGSGVTWEGVFADADRRDAERRGTE